MQRISAIDGAAAPVEARAACHSASATPDMVFTTFHPVLGRK